MCLYIGVIMKEDPSSYEGLKFKNVQFNEKNNKRISQIEVNNTLNASHVPILWRHSTCHFRFQKNDFLLVVGGLTSTSIANSYSKFIWIYSLGDFSLCRNIQKKNVGTNSMLVKNLRLSILEPVLEMYQDQEKVQH